jgi:type I restriction enzyme M protein
MTTQSKQIVDRAWTFSHVLRDDGLSYMAYTEQITFLLFLKMADELARKSPKRPKLIPQHLAWSTLLEREGPDLIRHYEHILEALSKKPGMLGVIFRKPRPDIQNPSTLRKLIVDLIEPLDWSAMDADVKGDIYEGILARSAEESPKGAGQYFTPRELIRAIVECVGLKADDTVCDPAAGTGGFLLAAHDYILRRYGKTLKASERRHLAERFARGWELVPNTARLCVMNLFLHGMQSDPSPIEVGVDSLARDPKERFSVVLTNPPFGRKSTIGVGSSVETAELDDLTYQRKDFWAATKNKQLGFLQHARTLIGERGRCAIIVPDNVLFEGGAGETVRRALLQHCDVHTLLRLPTGIFYAQGVKANVLFFDAKPPQKRPATKQLWIYDLRTDMRFTLRTRPLTQEDLVDFVTCYQSVPRHRCATLWDAQKNPGGRWRSFEVGELLAREKVNLDIFWLREAGVNREPSVASPDELAQGIVDQLQSALNQFQSIASRLRRGGDAL